MKRAAIVSSTLGVGTALVFGAAVLASALFPNGATIASQWNSSVVFDKGIAMPAPMPVPAIEPMIVDDGKGVWTPDVVTP